MPLNYNKIWSLINKENLSKAKAAMIVDMSETGFKQMMARETMSVLNLEKLADHFLMPISYFFDREEMQIPIYKTIEQKPDIAEDNYARKCALCAEKDKRIEDKEAIIIALNKNISLLEFSLGKNRRNGSE